MWSKPRILVVEDESGIADTLQYALATDGFAPVWCATAEQALREFAAQPPALVILDVGLPDLNGFALFKQLQALPGGEEHHHQSATDGGVGQTGGPGQEPADAHGDEPPCVSEQQRPLHHAAEQPRGHRGAALLRHGRRCRGRGPVGGPATG